MRPPGVLDLAPGIVAHYLPIALLVIALVAIGLLAFRTRRTRMREAALTTGLDVAVGIWLALTLLVTVVPMSRTGRPPIAFIPFADAIDRVTAGFSTPLDEATDIVLNVLLFMPFGGWAALRLGRAWAVATVAGGAMLSFGIEVTQALEAAGRFASATDVLTNTTGAALGFLLGLRVRGPGPD